jgi:ABC-type lipopolysaccharide export system ATPase subunit
MTIEAKNLLKIYGKRKVVNDVAINVERGEVVGLLGPNGAGKTTTFYMVVGLIKPNKGSIFLDGKNISRYPMYKRARLGLGYLPQEPSVFRKLTVEENILAIWQLRGGAPNLTFREKIELAIRKGERSWWRRERYEKVYLDILNDHKLNPEQQSETDNLGLLLDIHNEPVKSHPEKLYFLYKIAEKLNLNFDENKEIILEFLTDFSKLYKQGRKKRLEEFLNQLWKIKRDEIFDRLKIVETREEKIALLGSVLPILDIENPVVEKETETFPVMETTNNFIEYLHYLETVYWTQREKVFSEQAEEIHRMELLKSSKLANEAKPFLQEAGFKETEIKEIIESISWTKKQSQHVQLEDILDEFNISHIRNSKGTDLSGGERRRVEIARAVANKPSFLLLDEPFAGIDPIAVTGIKDMIVLLKNRNIGVLITDHNVRETLKIIDRGYILSDGKVIEQGFREHLAQSEVARKHYLGEDFLL